MRFVLPVILVGACGVLAACGSTHRPTTADQGVDASGPPPVDGSGSSGDSLSQGADAYADGPSDASGLLHMDGSGSSDGGGGIMEAGGSEAGRDAGKDASITDAAVADARAADTGVTDAGSDSAKGDAASPRCKRGIASNAAPGSVFSQSSTQPGVSWWYNWSLGGTGQGAGIEFVPMIWGAANLNSALPS